MLNDFIQLFLGAYHEFVPDTFADRMWFDSIIVCIAEGTAIIGAIIFGGLSISALFKMFTR